MKKLQIGFLPNTKPVKWRDIKPLQSETFKRITKLNKEKLKNSIRRNGFIQPFYVWEASDGKLWLLDGYHRILGLKQLDDDFKKNPNDENAVEIPEELPAVFVQADNVQEAAKRVALMSSQYAVVQEEGMLDFARTYNLDLELLKTEVSIPDLSLGNLIGDFVLRDEPVGQTGVGEHGENAKGVDVTRKPALFKEGLFRLGEHRIYAMSSLSETALNELYKCAPNVCITDPPYGVEYDASWRKVHNTKSEIGKTQVVNAIPNDDRADWSELWRLFSGNTILSFFGIDKVREVWEGFEEAGYRFVRLLIWKKANFVLSRGNYHRQYEPIFLANREGKPMAWTDNIDQSDVLEEHSPNQMGGDARGTAIHSSQKPVALITRLILNHTHKNEWVYDPFLGSGTSLIACENTNRRLIGGDVLPEFVEAAIVRWANHVGVENARAIFQCTSDPTITLDAILENRKEG